jgi:hypothetical protein
MVVSLIICHPFVTGTRHGRLISDGIVERESAWFGMTSVGRRDALSLPESADVMARHTSRTSVAVSYAEPASDAAFGVPVLVDDLLGGVAATAGRRFLRGDRLGR